MSGSTIYISNAVWQGVKVMSHSDGGGYFFTITVPTSSIIFSYINLVPVKKVKDQSVYKAQ